MRRILLGWLGVAGLVWADERTQRLVSRLPEEALAFGRCAPRVYATETLRQRELSPVPRAKGPGVRTVESRYALVEMDEKLTEIREVLRVDGKGVKGAASPQDLLQTLQAESDKQRRKRLEALARHGLRGVATDLGPLLLLFRRNHVQNYEFSFQGERTIGSQRFHVFRYHQVDGQSTLQVYRDGGVARPRISGEVWVDALNYRPYRVMLVTVVEGDKKNPSLRQEVMVDYSQSPFACQLPVQIVHREIPAGAPAVETTYQYTPFRALAERAR
jgi:hypothetical protein